MIAPWVARDLDKLRHPGLRAMASTWLRQSVRDGRDPRVVERLAADWRHLARVYGEQVSPPLVFSVFRQLVRLPLEDLPEPTGVRFLVRSLGQHPERAAWEAFVEHGSRSPAALAPHSWRSQHHLARDRQSRRRQAAVTFAEVYPTLRAFLGILAAEEHALVLVATDDLVYSDGALTARTDGASISFPTSVAVAPHREINAWAFVRVLAHEVEHIVSRSFDVGASLSETPGLEARLAHRRPVFERNASQWKAGLPWRALEARGVTRRPDAIPVLSQFFLHFPDPKAAHGWYNLVEDVRVDRILATKHPGLGQIARWIGEFELALAPHPVLTSAEANLLRALHERAHGGPVHAHVTGPYRSVYTEIGTILDAWLDSPIADTRQSLVVTLDVIEVLERHLPPTQRRAVAAEVAARAPISVEQFVWNRAHSGEERDPSAPPVSLLDLPEDYTPPGPVWRYPEYDAQVQSLLPEAALVSEQRWAPFRLPPKALQVHVSAPLRGPPPTFKIGSPRPSWREEGVDLDPVRAHDLVVARQRGQGGDARVFRAKRPEGPGIAVTFALDLSVSMVFEGGDAETPKPLHLAIALLVAVLPWLQEAGIGSAVYGAIDAGRRSVRLHEIKGWGERADIERLRTVHHLGTGGFRTGAIVRHLSHRSRERLGPQVRRHLVLLTDSDAHYLARGLDGGIGSIQRRRCPQCNLWKTCGIEPRFPSTQIGEGATPDIHSFFPTYYEFADLRHAVAADPEQRAHAVMCGPWYSDTLLTRTFGRRWRRLLAPKHLADAARGLIDAILSR